MRCRPAILLSLALLCPSLALAATNPAVMDAIDARLEASFDELVEIRRDIHRNAEPAGAETRTAAIVAERLREFGLEVQTGVGGHGVIGILRGKHPGPVIGYRADMDAMATAAADPVDFASVNPEANHVCGHDIHTTVALAIAEALASQKHNLHGTVKFVFQPAEETATGAAAMIEDGVMNDPAPDRFLALHCGRVPTGQLLLLEGMALPGLEIVTVRCSGDGDLEAAATTAAGAFMAINNTGPPMGSSFMDLLVPPDRPYRVGNVIGAEPDAETGDLLLTGFVKASDEASYAEARKLLQQHVNEIEVDGVELELTFEGQGLPPMVNDIALCRTTVASARAVLGEENVLSMTGSVPFFGEDFSYFQERVPGVMYFLGVANPAKGMNGMPHAPNFSADEDAILVGARAMCAMILGEMAGE
ncbi:amidohydrolase [bacterium]|nr:MAG: amidohydrolase [bacterium]